MSRTHTLAHTHTECEFPPMRYSCAENFKTNCYFTAGRHIATHHSPRSHEISACVCVHCARSVCENACNYFVGCVTPFIDDKWFGR